MVGHLMIFFNDIFAEFFVLILILIISRLWCRLGLDRRFGISIADWEWHNARLRRKRKSWTDGVLLGKENTLLATYVNCDDIFIKFFILIICMLWCGLGLAKPDGFAISVVDWVRHNVKSSSNTISPNGRLRRKIKSWMHGVLLGKGSYGKVYEGMSEEGFFFAVKEVSLLDQGTNAQQCIFQLEQEIALLSQFEHENIVQYYGTDKEDTKLFIFLELMTQGSLASLYQKYPLQDSQVSAYTRQILNGLKYLHDRNVMHRLPSSMC